MWAAYALLGPARRGPEIGLTTLDGGGQKRVAIRLVNHGARDIVIPTAGYSFLLTDEGAAARREFTLNMFWGSERNAGGPRPVTPEWESRPATLRAGEEYLFTGLEPHLAGLPAGAVSMRARWTIAAAAGARYGMWSGSLRSRPLRLSVEGR